MHYYGVDWIGRLVIAAAIWQLPVRPKLAYALFMVANLFSVALGALADPPMYGTIIGDLIFCAMHFKNIRKKSPKGGKGTWTAP
jgi:hypothetical protein